MPTHLKFIVNIGGGTLNPREPISSSWLIQSWAQEGGSTLKGTNFALVQKRDWRGRRLGRPIAIGSSGRGYGQLGDSVTLIDSQTAHSIGEAELIGWFTFRELLSRLEEAGKSATVYSFD